VGGDLIWNRFLPDDNIYLSVLFGPTRGWKKEVLLFAINVTFRAICEKFLKLKFIEKNERVRASMCLSLLARP
jgi:hypothetical protein